MPDTIFSVALGEEQADDMIERFGLAGFGSSNISILFLDRGLRSLAHGRTRRAGGGAVTGAVMGWHASIGLLTIPGEGRFMVAGPIMASLSHAAVGGHMYNLADSLVTAGVPRIQALRYEDRILDGNILLAVQAETQDEMGVAQAIMRDTQAEEIYPSGKRAERSMAVPG